MDSHEWFDTPNPNPRRRKTMEQAVAALAERTGRPTWPVTPVLPSAANPHRLNAEEQQQS